MPRLAAQTPSPTPPCWQVWLAAVLISVGGFGVYLPSLSAPFVFDDIPGVVQNESIRNLRDLGRVLNPPAEGAGIDSRPVINLSLALNYAAGGLNPFGYRLTNVAIHVLGALALFGLVRRTLLLPPVPTKLQAQALPVALSTALLWTLHPLQTETVICVIQRTESLVSLGYLAALYAFARAVEPGGHGLWPVLAWLACLLGMATKEVMVSAPLMLLLYDRSFAAGTFREAWRLRGRWYLALASTWLLLAWLVLASGGDRGGTAGFGHGVSAWTYLLTQARALTIYLKLSLWPDPLIVDYGDWLAPGLSAVLAESLLIVGLLMLTAWAVVRRPKLGFVGAVFFAVLAPSSSFYPLISQTIAEHRMHLPLAAVLTLLMLGLFRLPVHAAVSLALLGAFAAGWGTVRRGADYASEFTLWTDLVAKAPGNPWAHFNLGKLHYQQGRFAEAEQANRVALALRPDHAEAHFALGLALERLGRAQEAADSYQRAVEARPGYTEAHFRLGLLALRSGRSTEALAAFSTAVRLQPDHADARGNLGATLYQLGRPDEAIPHFEHVLLLRPDSVEARFNLAQLLLQRGRTAEALPHLEQAARLRPQDAEIQSQLQRLRDQLGASR